MRSTTTPSRTRQSVGGVLRSRRGAIAVALAVSLTALLGMAALASEAGNWLTVRRNAQGLPMPARSPASTPSPRSARTRSMAARAKS